MAVKDATKISPSTATAHIHTLEERLGVRLLNRTTRKVSLTEVGKAYYDRCLQILDELDDADNVAQSLQSTPRGRLHLNGSISIPRLIAPVIAEFTGLYPEVTISVSASIVAVRGAICPDGSGRNGRSRASCSMSKTSFQTIPAQ